MVKKRKLIYLFISTIGNMFNSSVKSNIKGHLVQDSFWYHRLQNANDGGRNEKAYFHKVHECLLKKTATLRVFSLIHTNLQVSVLRCACRLRTKQLTVISIVLLFF